MKTILYQFKLPLLIAATTLLLAGCGGTDGPPSLEDRVTQNGEQNQSSMASEGTLSYDLGELPAKVNMSQADFGFNAIQLATMASSCGKDQDSTYFQTVVDQFEGAEAQRTIYTFSYQNETQGTGTYQVFMLPNVAQYKNMKALEEDFESCSNNARNVPTLINDEWLVFTNSCPKTDEASDLPNGCAEIKAVVDESLKLN